MRRAMRNSFEMARMSAGLSAAWLVLCIVFGLAAPIATWALQHVFDAAFVYFQAPSKQLLYRFMPWLIGFLAVRVAASLENEAYSWIRLRMRMQIQRKMGTVWHEKLARVRVRLYQEADVQNLLSQAGEVPEDTMADAHMEMLSLVSVVIRLAGMAALFAQVQWWIPLGAALLAAPVYLYNKKAFFESHMQQVDQQADERKASYLSSLMTERNAASETRLFQTGAYLGDLWQGIKTRILSQNVRMMLRQDRRKGLLGLLELAFKVGCILSFAWALWRGESSIGQFVAYIGALQSIYFLLTSNLPGILTSQYYAGLRLSAIDQVMDLEEHQEALPDGPIGTIEFRNVCFSYPGQTKPVLQDLSFFIEPGERIALVGSNGAGKSTLIKLLLGIYTPQSGRILVDGQDCTTSMERYRGRFAAVFQDHMPYALTLKENVGLGRADLAMDEQAIAKALESVGMLPEQALLETFLGKEFRPEGTDLSYGQWQRVSIARALYANRGFLILDEPTASLDPEVEGDVYTAAFAAAAGRSCLLVSHRLGFAHQADRILVLDGGRLAEEGAHSALMRIPGGIYRQFFEKQAQWYRR